MKDLKDKVAVITGAGSDIGRALALRLAQEGMALALSDFNHTTLEATLALLPADHRARLSGRCGFARSGVRPCRGDAARFRCDAPGRQ